MINQKAFEILERSFAKLLDGDHLSEPGFWDDAASFIVCSLAGEGYIIKKCKMGTIRIPTNKPGHLTD